MQIETSVRLLNDLLNLNFSVLETVQINRSENQMHLLTWHVMHFYKSKCDSAKSFETLSFRALTIRIQTLNTVSDVLDFSTLHWASDAIESLHRAIINRSSNAAISSCFRWTVNYSIRTQRKYNRSWTQPAWLENKTDADLWFVSHKCLHVSVKSILHHCVKMSIAESWRLLHG